MNNDFFDAVRAGDADKVRQLIEADPGLLSATDENGLGAFTVARYSRQDAVAKLLLDKGAQLDIFAAAMAGVEQRMVELLAADRALVGAYSHDGWTPLHLACFFRAQIVRRDSAGARGGRPRALPQRHAEYSASCRRRRAQP